MFNKATPAMQTIHHDTKAWKAVASTRRCGAQWSARLRAVHAGAVFTAVAALAGRVQVVR